MDNTHIAAYCRISVDEELDRDNTSIENQKSIIDEYVARYFPGADITFFEDRDRSGYTFKQRESYQKLRKLLFNGAFDILIVKDFSRFSRRNSLGLYELETLRDAGVRIISIGDHVDYPKNDDWLNIQFRFLMNEMPVTDTSKKVRNVVKMRQQKGEWICNAPYGYYIHPLYKNKIFVDEEGAAVVRLIFDLYNKGWGYKKIAEYLTEHKYPTALRLMAKQIAARGGDTTRLEKRANEIWSPVTVSQIIKNDFYIGTLRQGVWTRRGINKADRRVDEKEHLIFPDHHEAIVDKDVFQRAQKNHEHRGVAHYKGIRKYENTYSGFLFCEDCGSPMFAISNPNRPTGYTCGAYHKRGLRACTSHHIHEKTIDASICAYITSVRDNLKDSLENLDISNNHAQAESIKKQITNLHAESERVKNELKETQKLRVRQLLQNPRNEDVINETFDALEQDFLAELQTLDQKIVFLSDESEKKQKLRQSIGSVLDIFDRLIHKEHFTKQDIELIIHRITVSTDKTLTIELKADITELFSIIS